MEKYQELMAKAERCERLALSHYQKHEIDLAVFFYNAAKEFKERALSLYIGG